ncbi:FecR family protein [Sphingopyxis sp. R3-92]|uniref:FecR family protein n=1 Tax=Sphingopyxis sp. R3-92 TaxID=3158553 RepID=UPI003EE5B3A0
MTSKDALASSINDEAIHWAVETAYGDMIPESRAELDAWLAADTRHRGAYVRACAWMRATEDAVVEACSRAVGDADIAVSTPDLSVAPAAASMVMQDETVGPLRGGLVRWTGRAAATGAALAASVALMVAAGWPLMSPSEPVGTLAPAKVVRLQDGSIATLGQDARIEVAMSSDYRRITLVSGMATFKVAPDKARPFVVRSGEVYAQATGTVYSVSRAGRSGGMIRVTEGSVLIWPRDERDQAVHLHAGGSLTLDPGTAPPLEPKSPTARPNRLPPPELAQISLDNVTVKSAVARFNRINSTKIVIGDEAINNMTIIGLYRADDPDRFAQAVAAVSGADVEYGNGEIVVKMK